MSPFYKLFNSGTSDGAKKGWELRLSHAGAMSDDANKATAKAHESGTESDHNAAALAHDAAADAHRSTYATSGAVDTSFHIGEANSHELRAYDHREAARKINKSHVAELRKYAHDNDPENRK